MMVLGKLPVLGRPAVWIIVGHGPAALAVGAGCLCLDIFFSRLSFLSSFSLGDDLIQIEIRLKGLLNLKQPTNQPINIKHLMT